MRETVLRALFWGGDVRAYVGGADKGGFKAVDCVCVRGMLRVCSGSAEEDSLPSPARVE